jgi:hypothetical protein
MISLAENKPLSQTLETCQSKLLSPKNSNFSEVSVAKLEISKYIQKEEHFQ